MCKQCDDARATGLSRRDVLAGVAGIAAAFVLPTAAFGSDSRGPQGARSTRAYAAASVTSPIAPIQIERRALLPDDIAIDVLYCGVCHTDIHTIRGEWGQRQYPLVAGHEFVGRVVAIGRGVSRFRVGDIAGVGCLVDSCGTCENCRAGLEQYCIPGNTLTYGSPDGRGSGQTQGGYSEYVVVKDRFVVRVPDGADLPATAPILCSGITTFSPMQHWKLASGQRFAVIGMGGLGHMALKLAVARGARATVFTTTAEKATDARRMGAADVVVWAPGSEQPIARAEALANSFDFMISTIPQPFAVAPFLPLLAIDGTFVNVGAPGSLGEVAGSGLWRQRRTLAASVIGGMPETQEVVNYCVSRNIRPEIQLIRPDQITEAFERVRGKQVRYRFVIDLASNRAA